MSARPLARPSRAGTPACRPRDRFASGTCCGLPGGSGRGAQGPREGRISLARAPRAAACDRRTGRPRTPRARAAGPPWRRGRRAGAVSPHTRAAARETPSRTLPGDGASRVSASAGGIDDAPTTPAGWWAMGTRVFESSSTYVPATSRVSGDPTVRASAGRKSDPVKYPPQRSAATPSALRRARATFGSPRSVGVVEARCHVPAEGAELRDEGCFLLPPHERVGDDCSAAPSQLAVRIAPQPRHVLSLVGVEAIDICGGVPQGELLRTRPDRYEDHLRVLAGKVADHQPVRLADGADDGVDALGLDEPAHLFDEDRVLARLRCTP